MSADVDQEVIEVDFYRNPTILSRLILNQKYSSAIKRVKQHPIEARTWVCSKRNPYQNISSMNLLHQKWLLGSSRSVMSNMSTNSAMTTSSRRLIKPSQLEYSMRQLPLHTACSNLLRTADNESLRNDLERLITMLVVTYPDAAKEVDHEGKLPMHECLWHNATPELLVMLLIGYPGSIHIKDKFGRTPVELNRFRTGNLKDQVHRMLLRGEQFWENARREALIRMKTKLPPVVDQVIQEDDEGEEQMSDNSEGSSSALSEVIQDVSEQLARTKPKEELLSASTTTSKSKLVEPITWIKLERRALHLEQLLNEMYEKNYELNEVVDGLTQEKLEVIKENEVMKRAADSSQVDLVKENDELKEKIETLEDHMMKQAPEDDPKAVPELQVWQQVEEQNRALKEEVDTLTATNHSQQQKIERLEMAVDSLRQQLNRPEMVESSAVGSSAYEDLIDTLKEDSQYATERYLASKVIALEEQLAETNDVADTDYLAAKEENQRLIKENEVLLKKIRLMEGRHNNGSRAAALGNNKAPSSNSVNSAEAFGTDSLEDIFKAASAMYSPGSASSPSQQNNLIFESDTPRMSSSSRRLRKLPAQEGPSQQQVARSTDSSVSSSSTATTNSDTEDDSESGVEDDLNSILREAERMYGRRIPSDLKSVLRKVSVSTTSSSNLSRVARQEDVDTMLKDAAREYGDDLPEDLVQAVRQAQRHMSMVSALSGDGSEASTITEDVALMQSYKDEESEDKANESRYGPDGYDDDDDDDEMDELGSIIREAEVMYGRALPRDLVESLRQISVDRDTMSTTSSAFSSRQSSKESSSKPPSNSQQQEDIGEDEVASILREAERIYGQPLTTQTPYMRSIYAKPSLSPKVSDLTTSSFSGVSLLSEPLSRDDEPNSNLATLDTSTTSDVHTTQSNFDAFVKDSEEAYGQPLPPGYVYALRAASFMVSQDSDGPPDIDRVMEDAEKIYNGDVPADLKEILRIVAVEEDAPVADYDDDLDTVLREAERMYGQRLSAGTIDAWKKTTVGPSTFDNLPMPSIAEDYDETSGSQQWNSSVPSGMEEEEEASDDDEEEDEFDFGADTSSVGSFDDLNRMFAKAAEDYSSSSRHGGDESSVATSASSATTPADNLEDMYRRAQRGEIA